MIDSNDMLGTMLVGLVAIGASLFGAVFLGAVLSNFVSESIALWAARVFACVACYWVLSRLMK